MTVPDLETVEALIDDLTTHRHGEQREPCRFCQCYYGDLVGKVFASPAMRTLLADTARAARADVESLPEMWLRVTQDGQGMRPHWRGPDYADGYDHALERAAEDLSAALRASEADQ